MAQVRSITWLSLAGVLAAALPGLVAAQPAPPPLPDAPPPPAAPASASVNMSFVPSGSAAASVTYQSGQPPQQVYDDGNGDYEDGDYDDQQAEAEPVVRDAPPALMEESAPLAPAPGYVWAPGYWYWYGTSYSWVGGRWLPPHPGY